MTLLFSYISSTLLHTIIWSIINNNNDIISFTHSLCFPNNLFMILITITTKNVLIVTNLLNYFNPDGYTYFDNIFITIMMFILHN